MITLISIIMIVLSTDNLNLAINNIRNQSIKSWELFLILNDNYVNTIEFSSDNRIKKINKKSTFSMKNTILPLLSTVKGDFICILNSSDTNSLERFEKQIYFLLANSSLSICSCLSLPNISNANINPTYNESDLFITGSDIDVATLGGYIPLDMYTFMIKKEFLLSIYKFLYNHSLDSELDFILLLLRYTIIEKVPEVLYYFKISRIPYAESLHMDNTLNTTNKIAIFNKNKSIQLRGYISEAIKKNQSIVTNNIPIKYNILIIIESLNIGGTETHILTMSKTLRKLGIFTYIITSNGVIEDLFLANDIILFKFNLNINSNTPILYKNLLDTICKIIHDNNIKLIHIHSPTVITLSCKLKELLDIPLILTIHGTFYPSELIKQYSIYISKLIFVSMEVFKFYLPYLNKIEQSSLSIVPNYTEPFIFSKNPNSIFHMLNIPFDSKIIVYCSRLSCGKSPCAITFLKSFEKIICNYTTIYAVIIGDGTNKILVDSYAKNINSNYKDKKVFVLGSVYNVHDFYSSSILVIGAGRVALEAMSCGAPVITLGLNKCITIVNEDTISQLINSNFGDHSSTPTENLGLHSNLLTQNIIKLLNDFEYRTNLGLWCKNYYITNFNINDGATCISNIFDKFIDTENKPL